MVVLLILFTDVGFNDIVSQILKGKFDLIVIVEKKGDL